MKWKYQWAKEYSWIYCYPVMENDVHEFLKIRGFDEPIFLNPFMDFLQKENTKTIYYNRIKNFHKQIRKIQKTKIYYYYNANEHLHLIEHWTCILFSQYRAIRVAYDKGVIKEDVLISYLKQYWQVIQEDHVGCIYIDADKLEPVKQAIKEFNL